MEEMLAADDCAIAIMSHPMTSDAVVCVPYMGETLHLSVPNGHLLASYDAIRFRDFNGYDIVVRPDVGFWMDVCCRHLSASRLLVQQNGESFAAIVENTKLLHFSTPEAAHAYGGMLHGERERRKAIRIADEDATAHIIAYVVRTTYRLWNRSFETSVRGIRGQQTHKLPVVVIHHLGMIVQNHRGSVFPCVRFPLRQTIRGWFARFRKIHPSLADAVC